MASVEQAFRVTNNRFEAEVIAAGRLDRLDAVYSEDATLLPPDGPIIEGLDAIKKFWTATIARMAIRQVKLTTKDIVVSTAYAHEIGIAELTLAPDGQPASVATMKYVVIWKLDARGQWRWFVDIWNGYRRD